MFKYASLGLSAALMFVWILLNSANNTIQRLEKELVIERTNFEIMRSNNEELINSVNGYLERADKLNEDLDNKQEVINDLVRSPVVKIKTITKIKTIYKDKIVNSCDEGLSLLTDDEILKDLKTW